MTDATPEGGNVSLTIGRLQPRFEPRASLTLEGIDPEEVTSLPRPSIRVSDLALRPPTPEDANAISILLGELGYPASADEVVDRLDALARMPVVLTLVAAAKREVFGVITSHIFPSLHSTTPIAWITTLIVSSDARGIGVGTMLLEQAERWAAINGAERVSLTSGVAREGAHGFYQARGYARTGIRFSKTIASRP